MGRIKRRGQKKQRGQRGVEGGRFQEGKGKISRRNGMISGGEEEDSRGEGKISFKNIKNIKKTLVDPSCPKLLQVDPSLPK